MRTSFPLALLLVALGICSCSPRSSVPMGAADPAYSTDSYCQIAGTAGLFDWTGGAFVTCPDLMPGSGDEPIDGSACSVSTVGNDGRAQSTSLLNVQSAQVLADGRILVWSFDGSLSLRNGTMPSHMIASIALDPWLDATRNRVVFVAPAAGATSLEPGDDRRVVIVDLGTQTELEVLADSTASSPIALPGTDQVLYVSSAGGTAAVWRASAMVAAADPTPDSCTGGREGDPMDPASECTPPDSSGSFVQLTNLTPEVPQTNVPPFGRQHVFVGESDTTRLIYSAPITTDMGALVSEIFALDPRTGDVEDLGPGAFPQRGPSGSVLARTGTTSCTAVQYLAPGATP